MCLANASQAPYRALQALLGLNPIHDIHGCLMTPKTNSNGLQPTSFLLLVASLLLVRPGAPTSARPLFLPERRQLHSAAADPLTGHVPEDPAAPGVGRSEPEAAAWARPGAASQAARAARRASRRARICGRSPSESPSISLWAPSKHEKEPEVMRVSIQWRCDAANETWDLRGSLQQLPRPVGLPRPSLAPPLIHDIAEDFVPSPRRRICVSRRAAPCGEVELTSFIPGKSEFSSLSPK